jgi:putative phosphoesterase
VAVRVCILSDTHAVLDDRVLSTAACADLVVHAGDVGNAAVLEALEAVCDRVVAVLGNNDVAAKWPVADRHRLQDLPEQASIALPGGTLVVEHGHRVNPAARRHTRLRQRHPDARAIVYGHSHRLVIDQTETPWVLNPGAAGRARTFGGATCLVLSAGFRVWRLTQA